MRKLTAILAIAALGVAAWFSDVEKQDIPHPNLLSGLNPGFENATAKWSITGGTLATSTANVAFGASVGQWDASASGEFLRSANTLVPKGLEGRACLMELEYWLTGGSAGDVVVRVETDGGDALTSDLSLAVNGKYAKAQLGFICPTADSIRIEFESTADASVLRVDQAYLGRDFRTGSTVDVSDWEAYTPTGNWTGNVTYTGNYRRIGDSMEIMARVRATGSPTPINTELEIYIPSGYTIDLNKVPLASPGNEIVVGSALVWDSGTRVYEGIAHVIGSTNIKIRVEASAGSAGGGVEHDAPMTWVNGDAASISVIVPIAEWSGSGTNDVTLETQGWYVDATIGGSNFDLSTAVLTSPAAPDTGSAVLTQLNDSASVGIACSGTNENTVGATTCSAGNEQPGIVFDAPYAGTYKFCAEFTHYLQHPASEFRAYFKLVHTENNSQTILARGGTDVGSGTKVQDDDLRALSVCGVFDFAAAGKQTIRLMRTQGGGTPIFHFILSDTAGGVEDQRNVHFYGYPITQQFPQAVALVGPEITVENTVNNDPVRFNIDGIYGGSTNQRWSLGMNTDANDGSLEIYDHTGTVRLQKWETSGNVTIGETGGPLVNIIGRAIFSNRGVELGGTYSSGTRINLYSKTVNPASTTSCEGTCTNNEPDDGANVNSGTCLAAWNSSVVPSTCGNTTNEVKFCLCVGVN